MQLPTPPKPSTAANLLQKLFGGKFAGTQGSYFVYPAVQIYESIEISKRSTFLTKSFKYLFSDTYGSEQQTSKSKVREHILVVKFSFHMYES